MTDRQLDAIARLAQRAGTPYDIKELLKNPLIMTATKEWAIYFIDDLINARWAKVKESVEGLKEMNKLKDFVASKEVKKIEDEARSSGNGKMISSKSVRYAENK